MRRKFVFFSESISVPEPPEPSGGGIVNLSMNGIDWQAGPTMPTGWQEYREQHLNQISGFLLYDDGTTSNYKVSLTAGSLTGRDDGYETGDDSGVVPDNVIQKSLANSSSSDWGTVTFSGLDNSKTYQIDLFGSYSNTWGWITSYRINGTTKTLDVNQNTQNMSTFTGLSPTSGEIDIDFISSNGWGLINAIILTEE